jgi:hypothetical protein
MKRRTTAGNHPRKILGSADRRQTKAEKRGLACEFWAFARPRRTAVGVRTSAARLPTGTGHRSFPAHPTTPRMTPIDFHTHTRKQGLGAPRPPVHTREVDPGANPNPPHWGAISVSLEGRRATAGLLLFHRAIRRYSPLALFDMVIGPYARFTQRNV